MKFLSDRMTSASGSIGGTTFSHNRGGMYTRARSIPTNPNSTRQNAMRAYFNTAVQQWSTSLTPTQRMGWTTWANNTPFTDKLGQPLILTGQQAYIRVNSVRNQAALPLVNTAPTEFDNGMPIASIQGTASGTMNAFGIVTSGTTISTTLGLMAAAGEDGDVQLWVGRPQNAAVNFYKGPYQHAMQVPIAAANSSVVLADDYSTDWGSEYIPVVGQRLPVKARILYDSGKLSAIFAGIFPVIEDA